MSYNERSADDFLVGPFLCYCTSGPGMCGHNGIVHGGLLATILDEAVARPVGWGVPNQPACRAKSLH